jgi:hypothetical protein
LPKFGYVHPLLQKIFWGYIPRLRFKEEGKEGKREGEIRRNGRKGMGREKMKGKGRRGGEEVGREGGLRRLVP